MSTSVRSSDISQKIEGICINERCSVESKHGCKEKHDFILMVFCKTQFVESFFCITGLNFCFLESKHTGQRNKGKREMLLR